MSGYRAAGRDLLISLPSEGEQMCIYVYMYKHTHQGRDAREPLSPAAGLAAYGPRNE